MELIHEIHRQIRKYSLSEDLEIVISSNGMKSETRELLESLTNNIPIRLIQNAENVGYDRNVLKVIENSRSQYLLLLSDDDLISPDFISNILETIANLRSEHILICSNKLYNKDFSLFLGEESFFKILDKDISYELTDLNLDVEFFGGLSGLILPVQKVSKLSLTEFLGTNWIQLAIILTLLDSTPIYIPSRGHIMYRSGNDNRTWSTQFNNISLRFIYQKFAHLEKKFIDFGLNKYKWEVRSNLLIGPTYPINTYFYFGGGKARFSFDFSLDLTIYLLHLGKIILRSLVIKLNGLLKILKFK